jgi:hypothetical protein
MGYLFDNIPPGQNYVICPDLYRYRLIVKPGFLSDRELGAIIEDEIPDVEEWQYSGRRRRPVVQSGGGRAPRRQIQPASYAHDSRRMRPFTEVVHYAFHTPDQRDQVTARLDQERISYEVYNEPGAP